MTIESHQTFLDVVSASKPRVRYVYFVGLLTFTMYCLFMGAFGTMENFKKARHILSSQHWEETEGLILAARTKAKDSPTSRSGPSAASRFTYQYLANNQVYASSSVSYHDEDDDSHLDSVMDLYTPGSWVPVYYDPHNPQNAVLEKGRISDMYLPSLMAVILTIAGIIGFYYLLKVWTIIENDWHGEGW